MCKCERKQRDRAMRDSCSMTTCALERRRRHHAQRNLLKQTIQTSCRWMLIPCTLKVAKGRTARVNVKTKVTDPDTTSKSKGEQSVKQRYFYGYCNQCGEYDTRNQTVRARTNSSLGRVISVEHMGTRELAVLLKRWHIWNPNL